MTYRFQSLGSHPAGAIASARGVNVDFNGRITFVVGRIETGPQGPTACIWLPAQTPAPIILPLVLNLISDNVGFYKVANSGDAIGNYRDVINPAQPSQPVADLRPRLGTEFDVMDINNACDITGFQALGATPQGFASAQGFIYNYRTHAFKAIPSAALGAQVASQMTCPFGINAAAKVVGASIGIKHNADFVFSGFLFSGNTRRDLGNCMLYDINDHDFAVGLVPALNQNIFNVTSPLPFGFPQQSTPMWMDCSPPTATPHLIPLPAGYHGGVATAVNNEGMVVGYCWGLSNGAFVYKVGQLGPALNLNALLAPPQTHWTLNAAWDISENGLIVGTASGGDPPGTYGFLLTPNT